MQVKELIQKFNELQLIYGDKSLDAIYGAGEIHNPKVCLVFMNPTGRNVSSNKKWSGLKAPWIGTKNIWRMFFQLGIFSEHFLNAIESKNPEDWSYEFANEIYTKVKENSIYITNLSKATQVDARHLKNDIFKSYLNLFREEIKIVNPKIIITFGNQVSSIFLGKSIKVSEYRKKYEEIKIDEKTYKVFPIYYPVGQGMRNIVKAKEDVGWILKNI